MVVGPGRHRSAKYGAPYGFQFILVLVPALSLFTMSDKACTGIALSVVIGAFVSARLVFQLPPQHKG